ncbi:MAG TPA: hypothetical protein VGD99_11715 [Anaerolineae bacterium]|jgi:ribosomal protein S18 acetylase RimI-like enzyme
MIDGFEEEIKLRPAVLADTDSLAQLWVVSDNYAAIRLYEKMGFKAQAAQRSHLLKWITGHPGYCDMVKWLR